MFNDFASESSIVLPSNLPKLSPRKSCPSKFTTKSLHPTKATTTRTTTTVVVENNHTSNKRPPSKHRKLPGPAGLLPKLHEQTNQKQRSVKLKSPKRNKDNPVFDSPERCSLSTSSLSESQSTSSQGEEAALLSQVQLECGSTVWSIIEKYSIKGILKMITSNQLPRGKIPVMCGFLDEIELLPTDAKALLKDNSGVLGCTIHRSVIKEYKNYLGCCSLLLLKQVSIFSPTGKKFYANITLSNIVKIYTPENTIPNSLNGQHAVANFPPASPLSIPEVETLEADCLRPPTPPSSNRVSLSPISKPVSSYRIQPQVKKPTFTTSSEQITANSFTPRSIKSSSGLGALLKCTSLPVNSSVPTNCDNNNNNNTFDQISFSPLNNTVDEPHNTTITNTTSMDTTGLLEDDMDDLLSSIADEIP
ncbi:unnamed protein product [Trichobilharzia szidati]|nr:unnamed protein product [Trichobilharzia szidati]